MTCNMNIFFIFLVLLKTGYCLEFRLGLLSPFKHPRLGWENNAAAATIAIEKAQSEGLLSGHKISVRWRDDNCNALGGAGNTMLLREIDDVDVIIGPPCSSSTIPSGLLASFWNFPMFSHASSDPLLADKSVYKTLVRLGPPFNKMGKAFVEIFNHFKWQNIVMVSRRKIDDKKVFCDYSSRSAEGAFRKGNITLADWIQIDDGINEEVIDIMLNRIRQRGRIIILCSENYHDKRRILVQAYRKGMMNGEYVYFTPDHLPPSDVRTPWAWGDNLDDEAKQAFTSVFQITVAEMAGKEVEDFRDLVSLKMADPPWNYNNTLVSGKRGSEYSPFLHDVVYLYLLILNETLVEGADHRNGKIMFDKATEKSFKGITGNVHVDSNGDRDPDYWIWDLKPSGEKFEVVMHARMTSQSDKKIHFLRPIVWDTSNGLPPFDTPVCGFNNELCYSSSLSMLAYSAVAVVLILFAIVGSMVAVLFYRRLRFEKQLELQHWRIQYKDIKFTKSKAIGSISQLTICSTNSILMQYSVKESVTDSRFRNQIFSTIGSYQNRLVTIRTLAKGKLTLKRDDYLELKTMYDLHHDNINIFIGLCDDERKPCLLMTYCTKGSLQDILENDDVKLDWMFKMSLIADLVNGMDYLHKSPIRLHGNLKSSNCVVDNRWVLKLTDFGLLRLRYMYLNTLHEDSQKCRGLLWTAPEHIPDSLIYPTCSRKGDVYSFGIILYEILHRLYPYNTNIFSPEDVIQRVKSSETPPFRPPSSYGNEVITGTEPEQLNKILSIMENCWAECPDARPTFVVLKRQIAALTVGRQTNIVDNMIVMLEKYSNNLEELVEQRTTELVEEKKKTDALLYSLLPASVAEKLKKGVMVDPEIFSSVTIFFSDIVGFTSLCSTSTAIEIVDFLNDLYTEFDSIIAHHDVYKVETIGDAYMVVSGLPVQNKDRHAVEIANMALNLQRSIYTFQIKHRPGMQLRLRIGIHTGPCAAGVVGRIMPRYCLFGDTVNIASRMESTGEAQKIHLSEATKNVLRPTYMFDISSRGEVEIKGKGLQKTYWLHGTFNHSRDPNIPSSSEF